MFRLRLLAVGLGCVLLAPAATLFTFEGLADNTPVPAGFYSAQGITSITGAFSLIATSAGGSAQFFNMPSPNTAIITGGPGGGAIFNVPGGFIDTLTVFYSTDGEVGFVLVYSGMNASGTLLGTAIMADNTSGCTAAANPGDLACWTLTTASWSGVAHSFVLPSLDAIPKLENNERYYYDDVSITRVEEVPEPATAALVSVMLLAGGIWRRRATRRSFVPKAMITSPGIDL